MKFNIFLIVMSLYFNVKYYLEFKVVDSSLLVLFMLTVALFVMSYLKNKKARDNNISNKRK